MPRFFIIEECCAACAADPRCRRFGAQERAGGDQPMLWCWQRHEVRPVSGSSSDGRSSDSSSSKL